MDIVEVRKHKKLSPFPFFQEPEEFCVIDDKHTVEPPVQLQRHKKVFRIGQHDRLISEHLEDFGECEHVFRKFPVIKPPHPVVRGVKAREHARVCRGRVGVRADAVRKTKAP